MPATDRLKDYRAELLENIGHFCARRPAAQAGLVRDHVAGQASDGDSLIAGPICLAIADALGVKAELRREAGLTAGLLELATLALRGLSGDGDATELVKANGLPLVLNSADALYSLAHLSLLDFVAGLEGRENAAASRLDALSLKVWEACLDGHDADSTFEAWGNANEALGRFAGAAAAMAGGRDDGAARALEDFGAKAAGRTSSLAAAVLRPGVFSEDERARLAALLQ